ncbi:MAG: sugar transferase [Ginsengibacter sp.]
MKSFSLAPVLLFVYKRLDTLKVSIEALQQNKLAKESELFIFSDGPKSPQDEIEIDKIRKYIKVIDGFKNIYIFESTTNKGLANSIIDGVTQIINKYDKVIVLEDDLLTSPNFLAFMNQCLQHYRDDSKVFSVSGYTPFFKDVLNEDVYFIKRSSSWGWATWKDRWNQIDWKVEDYNKFKNNPSQKRAFNSMGSDLSSMLTKQMEGKMNSWAIRWVYHQFKKDLFTVYPIVSKVRNIGFGTEATHTFDFFNRYETKTDVSGKESFNLVKPYIDKNILKRFLKNYSLFTRAKYKMLNILASVFFKLSKNKNYT